MFRGKPAVHNTAQGFLPLPHTVEPNDHKGFDVKIQPGFGGGHVKQMLTYFATIGPIHLFVSEQTEIKHGHPDQSVTLLQCWSLCPVVPLHPLATTLHLI